MQHYIVKSITRVEESWINKFSCSDVSTVYEAQGRSGLLNRRLTPLIEDRSICGPAVTVVCPAGDNLMIHAAVELCSPGDILVISIIGESNTGMIGELIVSALIKRGVQGVIIDAGTRDVTRIRELDFPVWTKEIHSSGPTKHQPGWVNSPAVCGEETINPGDLIMADNDGVVVIKAENIEDVWEKTKQRMNKENEIMKKIEKGETGLDYNNLRDVLEENQVLYYDTKDQIN